jgi:hypothetical protein
MTKEKIDSPSKKIILNFLLIVVAAFVLYQAFAIGFPSGGKTASVGSADQAPPVSVTNVVQVDVLNGCGA